MFKLVVLDSFYSFYFALCVGTSGCEAVSRLAAVGRLLQWNNSSNSL